MCFFFFKPKIYRAEREKKQPTTRSLKNGPRFSFVVDFFFSFLIKLDENKYLDAVYTSIHRDDA